MTATKRISRTEAAELFRGQQAPAAPKDGRGRWQRDPDARKPGRSIEPGEVDELRAELLKLLDGYAGRGVHRWHLAEIVAGVCCDVSAIGTSRGVDDWLEAERERRTGFSEELAHALAETRRKGQAHD